MVGIVVVVDAPAGSEGAVVATLESSDEGEVLSTAVVGGSTTDIGAESTVDVAVDAVAVGVAASSSSGATATTVSWMPPPPLPITINAPPDAATTARAATPPLTCCMRRARRSDGRSPLNTT